MPYRLRRERPEDHEAVERLTYAAFTRFRGPARDYVDEHVLVHKMRAAPGFVPALDYVAEADGRLVGNIQYTISHVLTPQGGEVETLTFGPVSVLPQYQGRGVGGALIRHTLDRAREMGYRAVVIYGHTEYYPRFGFRPAGEYGITTMDGQTFDAFMALELCDGALAGIRGRHRCDAVYELTREEVAAFNRAQGYPEIGAE